MIQPPGLGKFRGCTGATDGRILARLFLIVNSAARICGKIKPPCGRSWDCLGLDEDQNMNNGLTTQQMLRLDVLRFATRIAIDLAE